MPYNTITYNSILEACVKCGDTSSAEAPSERANVRNANRDATCRVRRVVFFVWHVGVDQKVLGEPLGDYQQKDDFHG